MGQLRRILLAEDNLDDAELTMLALRQNGLANEVVLVRDGTEVLDYFADPTTVVHPAVVLLDLKMPKLNGLDVLRWMRSNDVLRTVPVVMLTSSREERDLVESYRLGVNAYVVKPVVFEHFVNAVRQLGLFWAVVNEPPPQGA